MVTQKAKPFFLNLKILVHLYSAFRVAPKKILLKIKLCFKFGIQLPNNISLRHRRCNVFVQENELSILENNMYKNIVTVLNNYPYVVCVAYYITIQYPNV